MPKQNKLIIIIIIQKISLKARLIRRKNRAKKKAANESVKCIYFAGEFGVKKHQT